MVKITKQCAAAVFIAVVFLGFSFAQENILSTEGRGLGATPDEALLAAKRDAVEKGIGTVLLSQTEILNFQVKKDLIVTKTVGAVTSFETISEGKTPDGLFEVRIRAKLAKNALRQDLAAFHILMESAGKPRTMVIIDENNVGNSGPGNQTAETTVLQFLKDPYEFELVDPKAVASIRSDRRKMAALAAGDSAAAAFGSQAGAEVIITGAATSSEARNQTQDLGGMVSVQADVVLKAINCATGSLIGASQAHAAKVHVNPATAGNQAIGQASRKAIEKLLDAVIKEWQNGQNNGIVLSVVVSGVPTMRLKNDIVLSLQALSGVTAVRERSWDGKSRELTVDVNYKGNANGFCTRIDGRKMKSGTGSLSVSGISGNAVTLTARAM